MFVFSTPCPTIYYQSVSHIIHQESRRIATVFADQRMVRALSTRP